MLTSTLTKFHLGKQLGAQDIQICRSHVGPHIPNIGYIKIYVNIMEMYRDIWGIYANICGYMMILNDIYGYINAS